MNNYDFCAAWAQAAGARVVLDFGCGAGQVVTRLHARGIDAHGCDTFFEGADFSSQVPPELLGSTIRRMEGATIPFESGRFDAVINNMVMEHVPDLESALAEIARVLKPGGRVLSLFPSQELWFEGHSMFPLLHRFPKQSTPRVYFMYALSFLGFGKRKGRERLAWCHYTCEYLDKWLHYRTIPALHEAYETRFIRIEHLESEWLAARIPRTQVLPASVRTFIARRLATLAFTCQKPETVAG